MLGCGGGGGDPHEVVTCDRDVWGIEKPCERGCSVRTNSGIDANGDNLDDRCTITFSGATGPCQVMFVTEFDDQRGCCANFAGDTITFLECEGE
jgi:hypothetical protein